VLCDLASLETLNPHEVVSGLAEVVKCGFIADEQILRLVERHRESALQPGSDVNRELVERAIQVKADVVSRDLREATSTGGRVGREALNYGHTLGHAIERVERYSFRHGAAVSVGMVYVAELAGLTGRLDDTTVDRHREVLSSLGLPTTYQAGRWEQLLAAMKVDKKSRGDLLRFVVIEGIGRPAILEGPDPTLLVAAYGEISH
jgi:3-dehydroquinate synthase